MNSRRSSWASSGPSQSILTWSTDRSDRHLLRSSNSSARHSSRRWLPGRESFGLQTIPQETAPAAALNHTTETKTASRISPLPPPAAPLAPVRHLTVLPLELQYIFLAELDLPSLLALRHVCALYWRLITPDFIRRQFRRPARRRDRTDSNHGGDDGDADEPDVAILQQCCSACLLMPSPPSRRHRLVLDRSAAHGSWRTFCLRCWRRDRQTRAYERTHGPALDLGWDEAPPRPPLLLPAARGRRAPFVSRHADAAVEGAVAGVMPGPGPGPGGAWHYAGMPCRTCGFAVVEHCAKAAAAEQVEGGGGAEEGGMDTPTVHRGWCTWFRRAALVAWYALGLLQLALMVVNLAAAWSNYTLFPDINVPVTIAFALSWVIWALLVVPFAYWRKPQRYLWMLVPNAVCAALWIPPVVGTARGQYDLDPVDSFATFAMWVFVVALIFRVLDTAGFALLYFDYDPRDPYIPDQSPARRALATMCTLLTLWAYPRATDAPTK